MKLDLLGFQNLVGLKSEFGNSLRVKDGSGILFCCLH